MVHLFRPAVEEAFFDIPAYLEFAQLKEFARLPDESAILRFHYRLEQHKLAEQILATVNELLTRKGVAAQSRHSRRRYLDCSAHLDQKQRPSQRRRGAFEQEGPSSVTLA